MANTGFLQATIAYKQSKPQGEPLDINGKPISETGLRQAIYLLNGTQNPDPTKYQVEGYFGTDGVITGNPTVIFSLENCPTGLIYVTPSRIVYAPNGSVQKITLYSSGGWELVSAPNIGTLSQEEGETGYSYLELTPNANEGQGFFIFRNLETGNTAQIYVISAADPSVWILTTGFWNNLGFWYNNGIWNY